MLSTELSDLLWGNRDEPWYAAHAGTTRTPPVPKAEALEGLASGMKFFAPVPRIDLGNKKEHCARSFDALWVDVDRDPTTDPVAILEEARSAIPAFLWPPTAEVYSGNRGVHLYWKLDADLPISEVEGFNKALSELVGGDHCYSRVQLLRNPGTINEKSGRTVEILGLTGQLHSVEVLKERVALRDEPSDAASERWGKGRKPDGGSEERLAAADAIGGWGEVREIDLNALAVWEQDYLERKPRRGFRHHGKTRSEIEQSLIFRFIGKEFGASDNQVRDVADKYFAKHLEEKRARGYEYLDRSIASARQYLYERGWVSSPLGGYPKKRDATHRRRTDAEVDRGYEMIEGQRLSEWIREVRVAFGCSSSSAYRMKDQYIEQGRAEVRDGHIHRVASPHLGSGAS